MENAELIKALWYCAKHEGCDYYIAKDCPRGDTWVCGADCEQILMLDAADALEAAEKRIAIVEEERDLERFAAKNYLDKIDELEKELEIWTARSFEGKIGRMAFINLNLKKEIFELRAQLPKEGEWIVEEIDDSGLKWRKWRCSVCREVIKKGWQHTKDGEKPKWKYCPNCGAKMKGEDK